MFSRDDYRGRVAAFIGRGLNMRGPSLRFVAQDTDPGRIGDFVSARKRDFFLPLDNPIPGLLNLLTF